MRPSEQIANLLFRYLRDELSPDQDRELSAWRSASAENEQIFQEETDPENIRREISDMYAHKDKVWEKIQQVMPEPNPKPARVKRLYWLPAAAAILLISLGLGGYFLFRAPIRSTSRQSAIPVKPGSIVPGGNHAVLLLANGSVVQLDSMREGMIGAQGASTIVKKDSGELVYSLNGQAPAGVAGFNILKTPRGGQYQLALPDGTRVWLNAASSLKYPAFFSGNERTVELEGEAYFDVAKNPSSPFRVSVNGKPGVEVLGTDFNIMAYPDEPFMATTLLEGSVRIGNRVLKPGQQAQVDAGAGIRVLDQVDTGAITAWKNGKTSFKDASIQTIMRAVSRWYDVDISYQGKIPDKRFKGGLPRNTDLSQLLAVLEQSGIHFTVEGKKITVTP